jgi:hypothetical protein
MEKSFSFWQLSVDPAPDRPRTTGIPLTLQTSFYLDNLSINPALPVGNQVKRRDRMRECAERKSTAAAALPTGRLPR